MNEVEAAEVVERSRVVKFGAIECVERTIVEHYIGPGDAHLYDVAEINYAVVVSVDFITAVVEVVERCVVGCAEG